MSLGPDMSPGPCVTELVPALSTELSVQVSAISKLGVDSTDEPLLRDTDVPRDYLLMVPTVLFQR